MQFVQCTAPEMNTLDPSGMSKIEQSPRYKNGKFIGNGNELNMSFKDYISTTWEFLFTDNARTPDAKLPVHPVDLTHFNHSGKGRLSAIWLGHSSLMINMDGYKMLIDPVFQKRVSWIGPTRFSGEVPLDIRKIPRIDAVVISHDHYDHLNKYSVQQLNGRTKRFIVPLAVGARLIEWGVPQAKIIELDWWEVHRFDQNLRFVATPAQHFSGRGLNDRNKTLWASWVITTPSHKVFFSGDSGYFDGFKKIGDQYGPFDMTFIECGAYNPAWEGVHMFPEQTVQAHLDLKGNVLHPIHWGTFNLSLHSWYDPMVRLTAAARVAGVSVATPVVGDTTRYGNDIRVTRWWEPVMNRSLKQ